MNLLSRINRRFNLMLLGGEHKSMALAEEVHWRLPKKCPPDPQSALNYIATRVRQEWRSRGDQSAAV